MKSHPQAVNAVFELSSTSDDRIEASPHSADLGRDYQTYV